MKVAVISDTHVGRTGQGPPAGLWQVLEGVDRVVHLGDFTDAGFAGVLAEALELDAVCGNSDCREVRRRFPTRASLEFDTVSALAVHILPMGDDALDEFVQTCSRGGVKLVLFGHTHVPADFELEGVRFLNPGSAGDLTRSRGRLTAGLLDIDDGRLGWKIVPLGGR